MGHPPPLHRGLWLAGPLLALCAAARAADGPPRLAGFAAGLDPAASAQVLRVEAAALRAVGQASRFAPVRLDEVLDPGAERLRAQKRAEAQAAIREGQAAYDDLDTQRSLERARHARAVLTHGADLSVAFDDLVAAWLLELASQIANGDRDAARELEALLSVAPEVKLPPSRFPPDAIARAERVRAQLSGGSPLEVTTEPAGASIWVDGRYRGVSPVLLSSLHPGAHFVTAKAPGFAFAQVRTAEPRLALTLEPAERAGLLAAARATIARHPGGRERDQAARELGRAVGAAQVLLLTARQSATGQRLEVEAFRIDVADGHNLGHRQGTVALASLDEDLDRLLNGVLGRDAPRQNGEPVTHLAPGFTWSARTTGYAVLGAGAALLATGAVFGTNALLTHQQYRVTPQSDPRSAELRESGQAFALTADVLVLAGVLTAAGGAIAAFWPSAPAPPASKLDLPMPPPPAPRRRRPSDEDLGRDD